MNVLHIAVGVGPDHINPEARASLAYISYDFSSASVWTRMGR
jgi:hypothetical protein